MFELLPVNDKHVLAFKAKGKLTNEDYIQFLPELEKLIREEGRISLYVELEDFQGWDAKAAWNDLHFGLQHDRDFRRIAIIGDNTLEHVGVALANFFSNTEMRFFNRENSKDAWEWLKEIPEHKKQAEPLQPYRRLLLATDFSRYSEQAAHRAMELSRQYDAELQVLHIVEAEIFYSDYNDPVIPDALLQDGSFKDFAENNMASFAEKTGLPSGTRLEVQWGMPKSGIVSWAREHNTDLIIMGSHGRHGLERLLGSVSSSVLHQSPCDVLVVRTH